MSPGARAAQRAVDLLSCLAYGALTVALAHDVARALPADPALAFALPPLALAALALADFVSGLVHFLADTYCTPETPIIGPKLIAPFREHHVDPEAITRHGWLEANGDFCLTTLLVLVPVRLWVPVARGGGATLFGAFTVLFTAFVVLTAVAHAWAHAARPSRLARALQRAGLAISAEHHAGHHAPPHRVRYCITTGWLNGPLDRLRFFERLERALARLGVLSARARSRSSALG